MLCFICCVRLGCDIYGPVRVVDFSPLLFLLLNDSLLANQNLTSLSLPTSLVTISNYAFAECSSLTSLSLPTSLVTISSYAFRNCYALPMKIIPT
jgi:hypothetical protein